MANKYNGQFDVEFVGGARTLRFGFGTFAGLDRSFADSHGSLLKAMQNSAIFDVATEGTIHGLRWEEPKINRRVVEKMFEEAEEAKPGSAFELAQEVFAGIASVMNPEVEDDGDSDAGKSSGKKQKAAASS